MRTLFIRIAFVAALLFIVLYVWGDHFTSFYTHFGDPVQVQNVLLFYSALVAVACLGLFLLKPLIGIVIFVLILLILLILFQMGMIHLVRML